MSFLRRMTRRNRRKALAASFVSEALEARELLTTFGNSWDNPRGLTVSFPADGTPLGATSSQLRGLLDQAGDRSDWQQAILHAFQTWSEVADLNFGLTADRGDTFGAVGLSQSDPRFGDFRVGALPLPGVLANAVPGQAVAGTWSGDIFFSTRTSWALAADSGQQSDVAEGTYDLYTVALHEVGNALGLPDIPAAGSVMSSQYSAAMNGLTESDIAAVQALYGHRTDPFEGSPNDTTGTAAAITLTTAEAEAGLAVRSGSLFSASDKDIYSFVAPAGVTQAAITLNVQGISLLESELDLRKECGGRLGKSYSRSVFDNDVRVVTTALVPGETYFIHIDSQRHSDFRSGDYQLEVNFRPESDWLPVNGRKHDAGRYNGRARLDDADRVDLAGLFAGDILDQETDSNNRLVTATELATPIGFSDGVHYEAVGTVLNSEDRDFFSFQAPASASETLVVRFSPLDGKAVSVDIAVMNSVGDRVAAIANRSSDGRYEFQISDPVAGETYVVGMSLAADAQDEAVNYALTADFTSTEAVLDQVSSGQVETGETALSRLVSLKSQLFRLDLANVSAVRGDKVAVSIIDLRNLQTIQSVTAVAGSTQSIFVWLPEGTYAVAVHGLAADGVAAIPYNVSLAVVSDDEGPGYEDPFDPYAGVDEDPYVWEEPTTDGGGEDPYGDPWIDDGFQFEDPWANDPFYLFVDEIYYLEIE